MEFNTVLSQRNILSVTRSVTLPSFIKQTRTIRLGTNQIVSLKKSLIVLN